MTRYPAVILIGLLLLSIACALGNQGTAIPSGRPISFDVQTSTPTPDPKTITVEPEAAQSEVAIIAPLSDAPTRTPDPNAPPTPLPIPTNTLVLAATPTTAIVETTTPTPVPATATPPPPPTVTPVVEIAPPLQGGDWDFEGEFIPWGNPHGEPCPGARVASGWIAFIERGEFGSSCFNENLYGPNVFTGFKSQEITFDFIAANSGVQRTIPGQINHRYSIMAHAKHDRSLVPVQIFLGVDASGGGNWQAETVEWFPWDSATEDTWGVTEVVVTATSENLTIFIRGLHPVAEQGGKTVIDNVIVTDLGL